MEKNEDKSCEQEKITKNFLIENGVAFEQHKNIIGEGNKHWIVDFYLKEQGIIIECKRSINPKRKRRNGIHPHKEMLFYKDLFKLEELKNRYGLIPVFFVDYPCSMKFSPEFVSNITAHEIYFITNVAQILSIIQSTKILRHTTLLKNTLKVNSLTNNTQNLISSDKTVKPPDTPATVANYYAQGLNYNAIKDRMSHETGGPWTRDNTRDDIKKFISRALRNNV